MMPAEFPTSVRATGRQPIGRHGRLRAGTDAKPFPIVNVPTRVQLTRQVREGDNLAEAARDVEMKPAAPTKPDGGRGEGVGPRIPPITGMGKRRVNRRERREGSGWASPPPPRSPRWNSPQLPSLCSLCSLRLYHQRILPGSRAGSGPCTWPSRGSGELNDPFLYRLTEAPRMDTLSQAP